MSNLRTCNLSTSLGIAIPRCEYVLPRFPVLRNFPLDQVAGIVQPLYDLWGWVRVPVLTVPRETRCGFSILGVVLVYRILFRVVPVLGKVRSTSVSISCMGDSWWFVIYCFDALTLR